MYVIFLAEGFEIVEALATLDVMRRAGLEVKTVGVSGDYVTSSNGVTVKADVLLDDITASDIDGAILPGGMPGTRNLDKSERVRELVKACFDSGKLTAAICAAPSVLGHLGILKGKKATCFPSFEGELGCDEYTGEHVVTDTNVITAKGAGCSVEFGHAIVSLVASKETADKVISDMQCL